MTRRLLTVVLLLTTCSDLVKGGEYLVLDEAIPIQNIPVLGEGFDPERGFPEARRRSVARFDNEELRQGALRAEVSIFEVQDEHSFTDNIEASLSGDYYTIIKGRMGFSSSYRLFERNSIFIVYTKFISRSNVARNISVDANATRVGKDAFREAYGPQMVTGIDYGGYIILIYRFETRDTTERRNILLSLQASYSGASGDASFSRTLEEHDVRTSFHLYNLQDGGNIAPFLDTNLAAFRSYLQTWTNSVMTNPVPAKVLTADYKDLVSDFPFEWVLGFGDPIIHSIDRLRNSILIDKVPISVAASDMAKDSSTSSTVDSTRSSTRLEADPRTISNVAAFLRHVKRDNTADLFFPDGQRDIDRLLRDSRLAARRDDDPPGFGQPIVIADPDFRPGNGISGPTWGGVSNLRYDSSTDPNFNSDGRILINNGNFVVGGVDASGRQLPRESEDRVNLWEQPLFPGRFKVEVQRTGLDNAPEFNPYTRYWVSIAFDSRDNVKYYMMFSIGPNVQIMNRLWEKDAEQGITWNNYPRVAGFKETKNYILIGGNPFNDPTPLPIFDNEVTFTLDRPRKVFFECFRTELLPPNFTGANEIRFASHVFLRWDRAKRAYFMEVECWNGNYDLKDQIIKVSYEG